MVCWTHKSLGKQFRMPEAPQGPGFETSLWPFLVQNAGEDC